MQLFAFNGNKHLVSALEAERQRDYICPECRSRVRVRAGQLRTAHFYHIDENRNCRQSGKTLEHLHAQFSLQKMLPEATLELPFPGIARIADVAWSARKIVFEIQCSPISSEEVEARNRDYKSVGWTTIWIFHENRYNQRRLTAAEWNVRKQAHYFTDIDENGRGGFYTHLWKFSQRRRIETLLRKQVSFESPVYTVDHLHFADDGFECIFHNKEAPFTLVSFSLMLFSHLCRLCKGVFYHFFEKSCRQ